MSGRSKPRKLRPIASRHHTSLGNLAIAWLIAQPQTQAIVGARNAQQATANALAADIQLSPMSFRKLMRLDGLLLSIWTTTRMELEFLIS